MFKSNKFQALYKLRASIFNHNYNPENLRTGSKILRKKLVGPTIANYYSNPDFIAFRHLKMMFPQYKFVDEQEQYRLSMVVARKRRGKGHPAKAKK